MPRRLLPERVVWFAVVLASIGLVVLYLAQASQRVRYPYELEWLESGVIGHVQRIIDGHGLYGAPSRDWVPFLYTPLYDYVAAAFAWPFGVHFWVLRLISIAASLGLGVLIYKAVSKETAHRPAAIAAVGVYAGCYPLTAHWYDLARVDMLFMFLAVAGILQLRWATRRRSVVFAGLLLCLAAMTKQTGLIIFLPLVAYLVITKRWRDGLTFAVALLVPFGLASLVFNALSGGWFEFWIFELGGEHEYQDGSFSHFFQSDIRPVSLAIVMAIGVAIVMLRDKRLRWAGGFWATASLFAGAAALSSRMHTGGATNVLLPMFVMLAVDFGIAAGLLMRHEWRTRCITLAAVVLQVGALAYWPHDTIPTAADRRQGDSFIQTLRAYNGDVLVMSHPQYAVMADSPLQAGEGQIIDVLRAKNEKAKALLRASFAQAVHARTYRAIYLDNEMDAWVLPPDLDAYYQRQSLDSFWNGDAFYPVDTLPTRPTILYVLK